ncbi:hypothetical protein D3C86_1879180 [compost metagenome]
MDLDLPWPDRQHRHFAIEPEGDEQDCGKAEEGAGDVEFKSPRLDEPRYAHR